MALLAALAVAGCGGDDVDPTTTPATTATTTSGTTGPTGVADATEGAPIEDLVAGAAGVEPEEVRCGEEGLESALGSGGTCVAAGTEFVVTQPGEELKLDSLTVRLVRQEETRRVSGDYRKPRESKEGTFVVATLEVTNELPRSKVFDNFGEQVRLNVGDASYSEPFDVLNGVETESFLWKAERIKPGDSRSGRVVFDVPESVLDDLPSEGSILVLNFPDEGNLRRAEQIGLLRTG